MISQRIGHLLSARRGRNKNVLCWWLATVLAVVFNVAAAAAEVPSLKIGMLLPRVTLSGLRGGEMVVPDSMRGKVIVLHFWAGWCSKCKEEMPVIDGLLSAYGRKGVGVVAVNVGQKKGEVQAFVNELKLAMPVYLDEMKQAAYRYEVIGVPRTFILDRQGVLRYKIVGPASDETLKKLVLSLL